MQNQRKSQSSLFSDIAVAIQLMVKAAAARRRELLSIWCVPWHCAAPEKGPAAGAMLAPSSTQSWDCRSCWRVTLGAKAAWVSVLLWGSGFAPFPKLLTGSWHRTTQSLLMQNTSQLSCKVVPWWGKEHKFYLCSSDRLLPQQNSSFITSFPRCSSLYASERKHANGLIVFKEEKIYFRREFLQAVQPLLSLQNHSVHGMD